MYIQFGHIWIGYITTEHMAVPTDKDVKVVSCNISEFAGIATEGDLVFDRQTVNRVAVILGNSMILNWRAISFGLTWHSLPVTRHFKDTLPFLSNRAISISSMASLLNWERVYRLSFRRGRWRRRCVAGWSWIAP